MHKINTKYRLNQGFSLIELLVAVLITSIVVAAAYQLMTGSSSGFKDEDGRRMLEANLRNAELLIQRDIARAGYASGFDSSQIGEDITCRSRYIGAAQNSLNSPAYLGFQHHRSNNISELRIVASISDYDGFSINSFTSPTVSINPTITMPLVASQVNEGNLVNNPANNDSFKSIFDRLFRFATAVEITTSDNSTVVTEIGNVDINNYTFNLPANTDLNQCGIDAVRPLVENTVNPIIAINYRVYNNNLQRCITPVITPSPFVYNEATWRCEILVENIQYFDVFPLTGSDAIEIQASIAALNDPMGAGLSLDGDIRTVTIDAGTTPPTQSVKQSLNPDWQNVTVGKLHGVAYRFGATSSTASPNAQDGGGTFPAFINGKLFSHVRGSALFRTANTTGSDKPANITD